MGKKLNSVIVSVALGVSSLSSETSIHENCMNSVWIELSEVLYLNDINESLSIVDSRVVVDAVMSYFDEYVKKFKLSMKSKNQIKSILDSYFSSHSFFVINNSGKIQFYIDDKKEFSKMIKSVMDVVIEDMPFLIRKIVIPLFLWWNDTIHKKLDNLYTTVYTMKEKQYNDIIFDCVAWITKRVYANIDWKTTVGEYYDSISKYFPNKNWNHVLQELNASGQSKLDIRKFKYKK